MKLIKPSYQIISNLNPAILGLIEDAGRTCYKSEDKKNAESAATFAKMILGRQHESVIEHGSATVRFIVDRGVSHELVRHRLASFSQESTRYCNYSKDKFDNQITFIIPPWFSDLEEGVYSLNSEESKRGALGIWLRALAYAENAYIELVERQQQTAQQARSVLPNSLKTEIVVTANFREWRTIFKQRTSAAAHPQMREVMNPLLKEMQQRIPVLFDDIKADISI